MTPAQCRAARALLDWSQEVLAGRSGVSINAIRNFERGATTPIRANLAALRHALDTAGVAFIDGDGGGPGVRLKAGE